MLFLFHFSWQATFLVLFPAPARARVISTYLGHILVEPGGTFLPHYHPVNILELIASGWAHEQIREEYDLKEEDIPAADADGAITFKAQENGEDEAEMEGVKKLAVVLGGYGKLGWELTGFEKVGKSGGAFTGAWEAVFKRPIVSKGAGK
jgi:hypothetical protein